MRGTPSAPTNTTNDPFRGSADAATEASHDMSVEEPSGEIELPLAMASLTVSNSLAAKEHAERLVEPEHRGHHRRPRLLVILKRHPWRVLGVVVLVVGVAAAFLTFTTASNKDSLSTSTVAASCASQYRYGVSNDSNGLTFRVGAGHSLTADCQMIADCYVNHLSGMTNATWKRESEQQRQRLSDQRSQCSRQTMSKGATSACQSCGLYELAAPSRLTQAIGLMAARSGKVNFGGGRPGAPGSQ